MVTLVSTSHDNSFDYFSYREYLDIRGSTKSYDGVIANARDGSCRLRAGAGRDAAGKGGMMVSGNYFRCSAWSLVGSRFSRRRRPSAGPRRGRGARAASSGSTNSRGDRGVLGRTVRLNGTDFTVVGVAPEAFPGMQLFERPDFYMPLAMAPAVLDQPAEEFLRGPGRPRVDGEGAAESRGRRWSRRG